MTELFSNTFLFAENPEIIQAYLRWFWGSLLDYIASGVLDEFMIPHSNI
jgi:hypothetical protein